MLASLERSWELVKQSAQVLNKDRELLLFPVLSGLAVTVAVVSFFVPLHLLGFFGALVQGGAAAGPIFGYLALFLFYFVSAGIAIFFNSALAAAVMIRLRGGDPTLGDGLRAAWQRIGPILGYAAIAASVGLLLRTLRERGGLFARLVSSIGGLAWAVATYLVVPVLVVEDIGPIQAIKRSAHLLRETWGQQIAAGLGFGAVKVVASVLLAAITIPAVVLAFGSGILPLGVLAASLAVLAFAVTFIVLSTLESIYRAALYHYAATGTVGAGMDGKLLQDAFHS